MTNTSEFSSRQSVHARNITLGMFVLDTFKYLDERGQDLNIAREQQVGGAGTYFSIGARIFLKPDRIGQVVHVQPASTSTSDLDDNEGNQENTGDLVRKALAVYGDEMWDWREREVGQATTLALNTFIGEARDFKFLTPSIRVWPQDLLDPRSHLFGPVRPRSLHFPVAPPRAGEIIKQVDEISEMLESKGEARWSPELIWEPFPNNCTHDEWSAHKRILPRITVFSPNHVEALALCGRIPSPFTSDEQLERLLGDSVDTALKDAGKEFLLHMQVDRVDKGQSSRWERGVIIRCGAKGCLVFTPRGTSHIPAYWTAQEQARVVDVTGGGNAFMGGLVAGMDLADKSSLFEGALYATVAASYAIEQPGLPRLTQDYAERESWNHELPHTRLELQRARSSQIHV